MSNLDYFKSPKVDLRIDGLMRLFFWLLGVSVLGSVLLIFVFILLQILPLMQGASVTDTGKALNVPAANYQLLVLDEWGEAPLLVDDKGQILEIRNFKDLTPLEFKFLEKVPTAFSYNQRSQTIASVADNKVAVTKVNYKPNFEGEVRTITHNIENEGLYNVGNRDGESYSVGYGDNGDHKVIGLLQKVEGKTKIHVVTLAQQQGLFGAGEIEVDKEIDLSNNEKVLGLNPSKILVSSSGRSVLLIGEQKVVFFNYTGNTFKWYQTFEPFKDDAKKTISSADFILGDVSLVFTNPDGDCKVFSLYEKDGSRIFGQTKQFSTLHKGATTFAQSPRNKAFLIGNDGFLSLRYSTSQSVRWESTEDFNPKLLSIGGKYKSFWVLDDQNKLRIYEVNDRHPEASFTAYFKKVQYEGKSEPEYIWQSSGGSDEFEPKLSMIPLLFGTLKGTFYALLFSIPIAILAALYVSHFMNPKFKVFIKPAMEIMATLPSVVLGFLAALWVAPAIEQHMPSVFLFILLTPLAAILIGLIWTVLPPKSRLYLKPGFEFIYFLPVIFICFYLAWQLGPIIEQNFMVVEFDNGARKIADFRLWVSEVFGVKFELRNSLVVGIMMGFAVIPIIFTISEDALANVPKSQVSASYALGASRWQTAIKVVVPAASAGLFTAVMIGLGRAVGETMIVLMATGNTPLLDLNIFNGFRTLSANIAVELPEAPKGETLYRTLFLGAFLLFLMTFFINTIAELFRQHLRKKYKVL